MVIRNLKTEPEIITLRMPDGTKNRIYMNAAGKSGDQIEVPDFTPTGDLALKVKNKIISIRKSK